MTWYWPFGKKPVQVVATRAHIPVSREFVESTQEGAFVHVRAWQCGCGANLRIRSRQDHKERPTNFIPHPKSAGRFAGHSKLSPEDLTWDGLAEERGWKVDPVLCPACQRG